MSYYGDGRGRGPPMHPSGMGGPGPRPGGYYAPPPGQVPPFQQPPPGSFFPVDVSGYAQGRGSYEYVQPGYVTGPPYGIPGLALPQVPPATVSQSQNPEMMMASRPPVVSTQHSNVHPTIQHDPPNYQGGANSHGRERAKTSIERSRDSYSPPRRRSPTPEGRYERRTAMDRGRDDSREDYGYRRSERSRDSRSQSPDVDRFSNREERLRMRSPGMIKEKYRKSRKDEHEHSKEKDIPQKMPSDQSTVDIDALLKDERLRNVLFAGISKATAKLEQSLKQDKEPKDNIAFLGGSSSEAKSQLFPSASSSNDSHQKLRSILKRKGDAGDSITTNAAFSNLSALEKTLQILRGKSEGGDSISAQSTEQSRSKSESKLHGALGQLVSYDDDNEEETYLYGDKKQPPAERRKPSSTVHPFWSVDAVPASKNIEEKEPDTFEMKEKLFEKWRKSIQKSPERTAVDSKESYRDDFLERPGHPAPARVSQVNKDEGREELDSTVQNILQSIGFDFDLSQRMQQLARKKKIHEEEKSTGISNQSASFLGKSNTLSEELKASLLKSGNDLSQIDSLLQEARASARFERADTRREKSLSPSRRRVQSPDVNRAVMIKERSKRVQSQSEWSDQDDEPRRQRGSLEYEKVSHKEMFPRESRLVRQSFHVSERFKEDEPRDEYFYPEKDPGDNLPGVPLLTSYSSRQKKEDLSSGLLKSMRVENFRVMSRPVYDDESEEFTETRRVILSAKSERQVVSRSPSARESRSPSLRRTRKRSGSPLPLSTQKERRIISSPGERFPERKSPDYVYARSLDRKSPVSRNVGRRSESFSPEEPWRPAIGYRSPSPKESILKYWARERSKSKTPERRRSPRRYRSRSPIRRRSRSPRRRRSRSRSRSHSRTRFRDMKSPGRRTPPRERRRPPTKMNLDKRDSRKSDPKILTNKKDVATKKDVISKYKIDKRPQSSSTMDVSKMTDGERKAYLKKLLAEKDGTKSTDHVIKDTVECFEKLSSSSFNDEQKKVLMSKLSTHSIEGRLKILNNVRQRFAKSAVFKVEIIKLKKQQNELMRKNQRSGKGTEDPQLSLNEKAQRTFEREIERLSSLDLEVEIREVSLDPQEGRLTSKGSQSKSGSSVKLSKDKEKVTSQKAGNLINVPVSDSVAQQSTDKPGSKPPADVKKKLSASSVTRDEKKKQLSSSDSKKSSWTSVEIKDELPNITASGQDVQAQEKEKRGNVSNSASNTTPTSKTKIYYEYFDSGNHFCRHCQVYCTTMDNFFAHLHGKKHYRAISEMHMPWIETQPKGEKNRKVGQRRNRGIKASEMMIPVRGFYCSLCKLFCGDFTVAESHLRSDAHYNKYLDFIRDNQQYEKNLLLAKTKGISSTKGNSSTTSPKKNPEEKPLQVKENKSHLRTKTENELEEDDSGAFDKVGSVDMELDEEDERDDDIDVASKVPKMLPKPPPFVPPPPPEPAHEDGMKKSKDDKVEPLDKFLTIKSEDAGLVSSSTGEKIPVLISKSQVDLSSIPIPMNPPGKMQTVKSLKQIQYEKKKVEDKERKAIEEEKRMMGIDVDAEEEKPLAVVKKPPMLLDTLEKLSEASKTETEEKNEPVKPTSMDNLFLKLNKNVAQKRKHKVVSKVETVATEMEMRIQEEIKAKVEREKEKLAKQKQKQEEKERRREERRFQKKKIYSDSSSEESDSEEDNADEVAVSQLNLHQVPLPDSMSQEPPIDEELTKGEQSTAEVLVDKTVPVMETADYIVPSSNIVETEYHTDPSTRNTEMRDITDPNASIIETGNGTDTNTSFVETGHSIHPNISIVTTGVSTIPYTDILDTVASAVSGASIVGTVDSTVPRIVGTESQKDVAPALQVGMIYSKKDEGIVTETKKVIKDNAGNGKKQSGTTPSKAVKNVKTPGKKKKSSPSGAAIGTESDLFGFFSASAETVSQEARKKLTKKCAKKRTRGAKAHHDTERESFSEEREIVMEDFVVLSEIVDDDSEVIGHSRENVAFESSVNIAQQAIEDEDISGSGKVLISPGREAQNNEVHVLSTNIVATQDNKISSTDIVEKEGNVVSSIEIIEIEDDVVPITDIMEIEDDEVPTTDIVEIKDNVDPTTDIVDTYDNVVPSNNIVYTEDHTDPSTSNIEMGDSIDPNTSIVETVDSIDPNTSIVETGDGIDPNISIVETVDGIDPNISIVETGDSTDPNTSIVETGDSIDPNASIVETGDSTDPNNSNLETGDSIDPNVSIHETYQEKLINYTLEETGEGDREMTLSANEKEKGAEEPSRHVFDDKEEMQTEQDSFVENVSDEQLVVPITPSPGRGRRRGKGKKTGGRGRGRGKRATKNEEDTIDAPGKTDEDVVEIKVQDTIDAPGKLNEDVVEVQVQDTSENVSTSLTDQMEKDSSQSVSKRTRRGRGLRTSGRVTRSQLNKSETDPDKSLDEGQSDPGSVMEMPTTYDETDSLDLNLGRESVKADLELQKLSNQGLGSGTDVDFLAEKDVPVPVKLNTISEEWANISMDEIPVVTIKGSSDSDATITEDQDVALIDDVLSTDAQSTYDETLHQSAETSLQISSVCSLSEMETAKSQEALFSSQGGIMFMEEDEAGRNQIHQGGSDKGNESVVRVQSQPRDPPMSGIVSDIEDPESIIMEVDDEGVDDKARHKGDVSECEGLPTSGLGLDLDDVTDSISFPLEDDNA